MELYFIRHAQSQNNALYAETRSVKKRWSDPELTEIGRQQAQQLATFLTQKDPDAPLVYPNRDLHNRCGFFFTHLYCSLMVRAVATATTISEAIDIPLVAWPAIHERGGIYNTDEETGDRFGLPGKDPAYFRQHYPHLTLPDSWVDGGWWNSQPYEEIPTANIRARSVLLHLLERHGNSDNKVAIVSHGGFFSSFMTALFDTEPINHIVDPTRDFWFRTNNVSITRIHFFEDSIQLVYVNRVDFLPTNLLT